jgi:hypothetical protein
VPINTLLPRGQLRHKVVSTGIAVERRAFKFPIKSDVPG